MVKKILSKIFFLISVLVFLNVIYTFTLFRSDLDAFSKEIPQIRDTHYHTDIYYFGESSNVTYAKNDSSQKSISELTSGFFPSLKITNINKYATHAGIYNAWLQTLNHPSSLPKAIIITLNLRSFDAAWIHSDLETTLQQSIVFTKPFPNLCNRFLLSLQSFDNKTKEQREKEMLDDWEKTKLIFPFDFKFHSVREWDDAMASGGHLKLDGTWDTKKITLACHYIKGYAFNLSEKNPRVKDFDEIKNWCEKKKVKLYLNLMSENIQYADSLVGKELVFLMKQNRDYLVSRYSSANCTVVDNLESVNGKDFIDQNWTTEHYNIKGRMRIAKNLALSLCKDFSKEFQNYY